MLLLHGFISTMSDKKQTSFAISSFIILLGRGNIEMGRAMTYRN